MAREALTGSRIRERRIMAGQKQADLARQIGISASYLNLIEHNRRRIGGKLLLDIASALGVEPHALTEGAEAALIATLREAAMDAGLTGPDAARADEFAGRFPGWADVLAGTRRRIATLEQTVEALTDRLAHDPHLAASMHELLTTAAAIRSTASILVDTKTLQPEWRDRFHANIDEDSRRLSDSAQALVAYLDADSAAPDTAGSPQEEVEAFLTTHGFYFEVLESRQKGDRADVAIEDLVHQSPLLQSLAAQHIAKGVLRQVARDAARLPITALRDAIAKVGPDPVALARALHQPTVRVLRRIAALPEIGAGLVVCDRSGTVIFRKSIDGFTVPRHGASCPLWPLFSALGHPGGVIKARVTQLGAAHHQFDSVAASEAVGEPSYNTPPLLQAVMLLVHAPSDTAPAQLVGSTCRICPHEDCGARREPSILAKGI